MPRVPAQERTVPPESTVNVEWRPQGRHVFRVFQASLRDTEIENTVYLLRWDRWNDWTQELTLSQWETMRQTHGGMLHEFVVQEVAQEVVEETSAVPDTIVTEKPVEGESVQEETVDDAPAEEKENKGE